MTPAQPDNRNRPAFLAESTLGKLAKWLRLAGFDAECDAGVPSALKLAQRCRDSDRIVLTRTRRVYLTLGPQRSIFIGDDHVRDQLHGLFSHLDIRWEDLRPLTICSRCNQPLKPVVSDHLRGKVPEYIRHHHRTFQKCPQCRTIYWSGSHAGGVHRFFGNLFAR